MGTMYVSKLFGLPLVSVQLAEGEGGELVIGYSEILLFILSVMFIKDLKFFLVTYYLYLEAC